jgi:spermidine synthase
MLTARRYDAILSEPSTPWMAGVASLFTRDFFALVRSRLAPGGVFCQWMHVYGMPVEDVRTVVGGFADVFPQSALFQVSEGDLLLLGAEGAWPEPAADVLASRLSPAVADHLRGVGVTGPRVLATLFVLGPGRLPVFAGGAPRHTDDRPILELRAARAMLARTTRPNREALLAAQAEAPVEPWTTLTRGLTANDLADRGRMLERTTGIALALEAYGHALRIDPTSVAAQQGLVRIARVGDAGRVSEALLRRLAEGPDPLGARVSLAELYHAEGRIADAGRELDAVLAADPSHLRALKTAAAIQGELGQAGAVEVLAGRAATLSPGDAEAAALLASASLLAGDPVQAAERAEAALRLDPASWRALRVRAIALAQAGRFAEAGRAFDVLLETDADSYESWAHAGAFRSDRSDWGGAAAAFERATDLAPDSRTAWEGLARAAAMLQDPARSLRAEAALRRIESEGGGRRR